MTDAQTLAKQDAALQAADLVESGMVLGLGSGSTAALFVEELGRRIEDGALEDVAGVPSSRVTHQLANLHRVPVTTLDEHPRLDLTVDGADEVDPELNLIKGLGGALLREKMVASVSRRLVIVADESKRVGQLGSKAPLPVEVVQFGAFSHEPFFRELGGVPIIRRERDGTPYVTDEQHFIFDLSFENGIPDPANLDRILHGRPGVVETGLFLGFQPQVIIGRAP